MPKLNAETFTGPMFLFGASIVAMGSMIAVVVQSPSSSTDKATVSVPIPPTTSPGATTTSSTVAADTTPPPIFVTAGLDGSSVSVPTAVLTGTTEPGAMLTVGGANVAVDPTGAWTAPVTLTTGPNTFAVVAADAAGNTSTKTVVITYTPELQTTSTTAAGTTTTAPPTATTAKPKTTTTKPVVTTPATTPPATTTTLPPDTGP